MGSHISALRLHDFVPPRISTLIQFVLATPVVLWAGWRFFERAWASVLHRRLNMFSLIALGTGASYLYSLCATFSPGMFPAGFRGWGYGLWLFQAAAVSSTVLVLPQVRAGIARTRANRWCDPRIAQTHPRNQRAVSRQISTDEEVPPACRWGIICASGQRRSASRRGSTRGRRRGG
jgi:Cu+-exporting ATPase